MHVELVEIVAQQRVIKVDELAQMSVHNESSVVDTEFALSRHFKSHHFELLTSSCSRCIHIEVDLLDIEHDEAAEALSRAERLEHVLPVVGAVNLVSPHRVYIDYMHSCRDLVDENEGPDAAEDLL